jgi:hypothetical protein
MAKIELNEAEVKEAITFYVSKRFSIDPEIIEEVEIDNDYFHPSAKIHLGGKEE